MPISRSAFGRHEARRALDLRRTPSPHELKSRSCARFRYGKVGLDT